MRKFGPLNITALTLGLAFLYLPIAILIINSFNGSRLVTTWGGWSLRWYRALANDSAMLDAARVSFSIAFLSATRRDRARHARGARADAGRALPRPHSVLRHDLCAAGDAGSHHRTVAAAAVRRGRHRSRLWTIAIAHTTLTMCFVAVVVQARLVTFDRSLEEAALDLGCPPLRTFFAVTLPLIWPAVASGWMLAFALSLDDLVLASFVTGPGATTLPIRIYSEVRLGVKPEINAVCTIMIAVVATGLIAASLLNKRRQAQIAAPLGARL